MLKRIKSNIISKMKKKKIKLFFNTLYKYFKKYLSTNILFLSYVLTSVLIGFLLRFNTIENPWIFKAFLCDLIVVVAIGSFGYLFKPQHQFRYFFTICLVYTLLGIINAIYYRFFSGFISASLLGTVSQVKSVSDSVFTRLKPIHFIYIVSPVIMLIVNNLLSKKNYYFNVGKYEKGKKMFIKTIVSSLICIILVVLTIPSSDSNRFVKLWHRNYTVEKIGIYTYTLTDLIQSVYPSINPMFGYEEAESRFIELYNKKNKKERNDYTNIFEGKNVLFIHAESIQNFLIDLEVNGIVITPNLNKLAKEGLYFSSFYPQISVGTSSDTEFTLSTGLLPSTSGTVFVNYYDRTYESIQKAFKKKGYYTFSAHANDRTYWNREEMYKALGYDDFYAKDNFEIPIDSSDQDIVGLGLGDKAFYKQLIPILKEIKESNSPFMGTIISLSNHSPFNDTSKYGDIDFSITFDKFTGNIDEEGNNIYESVTVPYLEDSEMGNYLKSSRYSDEAYGELLNMLEEEGLLEDTVIILYGDHESKLGKKNLNLLYNYDPSTNDIKSEDDPTYISLENYRYDLLKNTPLIIWTNDESLKKEISDVMGMWDIYPTVANMFNLEYNYAMGHDIFSNNEKIVVFPNGDIITNKVFFNNLKEEYIQLSEEPISNNYIELIKEYAEIRLDVSKGIIIYDLLKEGRKDKNGKS